MTNSGAINISASTVTGGVVTVGANPGDSAALNILPGGMLSAITSDYVGLNNGNVYIGANGRGTMTMAGSGVLTATSLYVGFNSGATGIYTQSGGLLAAQGTAYNATNGVGVVVGSVAGSSGTLNISGGTMSGAAPIMVWSGSGTITISQTGSTPTFVNPGWITLGQNSGAVATLIQNGGTLATQNNELYVGYGGGAKGNCYLHGGSLTTDDLRTDYGTGTMYQDGGSATVNGSLRLGINAGASGIYTLAGGILNVGGSQANVGENGTGTLTIGGSNGGTMVVAATTALTVANGTGSGTLKLQSGGLLQTPDIAAGSGAAAFNFSGGTLQNTPSGNLSVTMPVNLSGSGTVVVDGGQTAAFAAAAVLSGTGGLTKTGAGTMFVQSHNTYSGPTAISGGVLQLGNPMPQLAYSFSSGSAINTGNNASTVTSAPVGSPVISATGCSHGLGAMSLNGANYLAITASSLPNLSGNTNYTIGMWINTTEAGASVLYKGTSGAWSYGDETFYLTSGTPNSNNGGSGTTVGGVQWGGGFVGGNTAVNTGTWQFISIVRSGGASTVYVNGVSDGVTTIGMGNNEQGTQFIALGYNSGVAHDGALMYSGSISGTYVYNTALTVAQIQSLMNAGPTETNGSLPSATNLSIPTAGAALDLDGAQQAVASLSGVAGSSVYLGGGALTVGNTGSTLFAGAISDSGGVSAGVGGSLILNGHGLLELAGNNSYSGSTTITAGTLQVGAGGNTGALGTGSVVDTSVLVFDRSDSYTLNNNISGAGSLYQIGSGTLNLAGANTFTGNLTINGGTLQASNGLAATGASGSLGKVTVARIITVNNGGTLAFTTGNVTGNATNTPSATLVVNAGGVVDSGTAYFNSLGPINLNGGTINTLGGFNATYGGFQLGGTVTVNGGTATSKLASPSGSNSFFNLGDNVSRSNTTFNVALGGAATGLLVSGDLEDGGAGDNGLVKTGAGLMELTGTDTYTGGTMVEEGTLVLATPVAIAGGSSLTVGSPNEFLAGAAARNATAPVPEPGTMALLTVGLLVGSGPWWKKKRA